MSPATKKNLTGALKVGAVVLVVSLGIWGCARKPADRTAADGDRVRALEGRCVKLEQDYRTAAQTRDRARQEQAALEAEVGRLRREAADRIALIKERDELRRQAAAVTAERARLSRQLGERTAERDQITRDLNVRTAERDTALGRFDRLRKTLQNIVAQDDAAANDAQAVPTAAGPSIGSNS